MPRYFPSKVDSWFYLSIVFVAIALVMNGVLVWTVSPPEEARLALMVLVPIAVLALGFQFWLLRATGYTLESNRLLVKCGPFSWSVPLIAIKAMTPTRNPLSSPALSLDRLLIEYDTRKLMISPVDKDEFVRAVEAARAQLLTPSRP